MKPGSCSRPVPNLFEPPPPYNGNGRPRVKVAALPKPRQAAAEARRLRRRTVAWYGGGSRRVGLLSGTGHWYKSGAGPVPIRWVFVRDRDGTHRDEFFFSTDPTLDPVRIIETYTARWNLETTFQEMRALLGLETTRGWCRRTVLGMTPCLFGLYTSVALLYRALPESKREGRVDWPWKPGVTFSDGGAAVAVAGVGFPAGGGSPGRAETPGAGARTAALWSCTDCLTHSLT